MAFRQDSAQTLALAGTWLAGRAGRKVPRLPGGRGTGAAEVWARAADPEMLGSVLDFLLADEAALLQFCAEAGLPPETPMQARAALPGGDVPFWT